MQGLSLASLKKHPYLIPLYVCVGVGVVGAIGYGTRVAVKNPEVMLRRKQNPEPWEEYRAKQYKLYSPVRDNFSIVSQAPKYMEGIEDSTKK